MFKRREKKEKQEEFWVEAIRLPQASKPRLSSSKTHAGQIHWSSNRLLSYSRALTRASHHFEEQR